MPAAELSLTDRPPDSGGAFRAALIAIYLLLSTAFASIWAVAFGILGFKRVAALAINTWSRGIVFLGGIRIEARGRPLSELPHPCVFLANHQSALDIPILLTICRHTHRPSFLAKESLFKIPLFGWGMRANGYLPIRRESAKHSAQIFKEMLQSGGMKYSYVIFPEGTRSPDGRMQPLKRGTLGLAMRLGLPVVPVTIIDACRANPKGTYLVRPGTVRVVFHDPIPVSAEDADRAQRDELLEKVSVAIASALPEEQKPEKILTTETTEDTEKA